MTKPHTRFANAPRISLYAASSLVLGALFLSSASASAQQVSCPNPAMEARLYRALLQNIPSTARRLNAGQRRKFARCQIRVICNSRLDRTEIEMYAIETMTGFGDDQAEREKIARWSRDGRKHQSAMDKVLAPNALDAKCLGEAR